MRKGKTAFGLGLDVATVSPFSLSKQRRCSIPPILRIPRVRGAFDDFQYEFSTSRWAEPSIGGGIAFPRAPETHHRRDTNSCKRGDRLLLIKALRVMGFFIRTNCVFGNLDIAALILLAPCFALSSPARSCIGKTAFAASIVRCSAPLDDSHRMILCRYIAVTPSIP